MRVLVVDSHPAMTGEVAISLRSSGFQVDMASGQGTALTLARATPYDAILLELRPPSMSGYEAVRRLRAARVWTPVVLLTEDGGRVDADAIDVGVEDLLRSDVSHAAHLAQLRRVIACCANPVQGEVNVGDLVLDPARRGCRRGGVRIELTPREFEVLDYLMRRGGQVVPKADILTHVWNVTRCADQNLVEVYVGYLRRKIDTPFGRRSLETIRGQGYRLNNDMRRVRRD